MHTVIIGNGISGITAARWIRKLSDYDITVISNESEHFYSRTALMYIYMGHMRYKDTKPYEDWFWEKNRINLVYDNVSHIQFADKQLQLDKAGRLNYDKLIIATGSKPNKFGWTGQDLNRVGGLYHLQDLQNVVKHTPDIKRAVIVGGGLIGIEMAEMFHSRKIDVTFLVREQSYWNKVLPPEESAMVTNHIKQHHIDLRLGVNLGEIHDNGNGNACAVTIKETGERIDCQYVGLTAGVRPNLSFSTDAELNINRGILVNRQLKTNIADVYAIGDCAEQSNPYPNRRPLEAVWYTGRMMGETVAQTICKQPTEYNPSIWFNSAKFFDIEYQVYGDVPAQMPDDLATFYWQHPSEDKAIRLVFAKGGSEPIKGFNLMGIRFRHEVCEQWLREETPVTEVVKDLRLANFDPEFYDKHEDAIIRQFNSEYSTDIRLRAKGGWNQVFSFFKQK